MLHWFKWRNPGGSALTAALENKPWLVNTIEKSLLSYEKGLPDYYMQETAKVRLARQYLEVAQGKAFDEASVDAQALPDEEWSGLAILLQFSDALSRGRNGDKDAANRAREIFNRNFQSFEKLAVGTLNFDSYAGMRDWAAKPDANDTPNTSAN
jgi:hypothetical protein